MGGIQVSTAGTFSTLSIVTNGLQLYLDAGKTASYPGSGTTWYDISGNEDNATLFNSPTYSGDNGGTLLFDGVNDYATTVTPGQATGTLMTWIKTVTSPYTGSFFSGIIDCDTPAQYGTGIGINNSTYQAILDDQFYNPGTNLALNTWEQVALTWNSTTAKFYKNNLNTSTTSYTQGTVTTSNYVIGKSNANEIYTNAYISVVCIYNRVLDTTEIVQNYNFFKSRFGL